MIYHPSLEAISELAQHLLNEEIVALPTETVYGLAGLATSDNAIAAIYAQKKRPQFNPLIIHGNSLNLLKSHVEWNAQAAKLAEAFWPGPLTFVLPKRSSSNLSLLALAGLETVAIRMPNHPLMQSVLDKVGLLAAPSANPSGSISPTCAEDVEEAFKGTIPVLDGGRCEVGLESTILDLSGDAPQLLRPGGISVEDIERVIGSVSRRVTSDIKAPGQLTSHYAPRLPLRINVDSAEKNEAFLAFGTAYPQQGDGLLNLSSSGDLREAAAHLFAMLRQLDRAPYTGIAVAPVPNVGLGLAINDRLKRAAAPRD